MRLPCFEIGSISASCAIRFFSLAADAVRLETEGGRTWCRLCTAEQDNSYRCNIPDLSRRIPESPFAGPAFRKETLFIDIPAGLRYTYNSINRNILHRERK